MTSSNSHLRVLPHPRNPKTGRFRKVMLSELKTDALLEDIEFLMESGEAGVNALNRLIKTGQVTSPKSLERTLVRRDRWDLWRYLSEAPDRSECELRDKLRKYKLKSKFNTPELWDFIPYNVA